MTRNQNVVSKKQSQALVRNGGDLKQCEAQTVIELNELIAGFGSDVLFRGQTAHYGKPGLPSIITSFDRTQCIPSEMLKWCRYSQNVLDTFIAEHRTDFRFQQALLQHYGWRSFFIDCTSDSSVAAWFASHKYSEKRSLEISEDCDERAVWLRKRMAGYTPSTGEGHIYIFSKQAANEIGLVDLGTLSVAGFRPRTVAQSAWLLGPQHGPIPQDCYLAQITAPAEVLQAYAAHRGLIDTNKLFPSPAEDPILKALLGLPWEEINAASSLKNLPAFKRSLELPEYHPSFVRIAPAQTAFYRGARILDTQASIDGDPHGGIIVEIPDMVLYGSIQELRPHLFPMIEKLVEEHGTVAFEAPILIKHASLGALPLYQKGIGVLPWGPDLFELCELTVNHPGLELKTAGFTKGWRYRRQSSGIWAREVSASDCPCDNEIVHHQHINALHIAEDFLRDPLSFA